MASNVEPLKTDELLTIDDYEKKTRNEISLSDAWRQIFASCIIFMITLQVGTNIAYSGILLPQLREEKEMNITTEEASWIASLIIIPTSIGSLIAGPLMDKYGRKTLSIIAGVFFLLGWIKIAFASTSYHFYIARILTGLGAGICTVAFVYSSELSHPTYRPMLLLLNSVFVSTGILITWSMGISVEWRTQAFVSSAITVLTIILHWPLPESPYWLPKGIKREKALRWLYTNEGVYESQSERLRNENKLSMKVTYSSFFEPIVYRPIILLTAIFLFQQLSGCYVIVFYLVDVLRLIGADYENFIMFSIGFIRFVMAVMLMGLSRVYGRRTLLFVSGIGMSFSCFIVFLLKYFCFHSTAISIFVLAFVCFAGVGFENIPWGLIGELFPVELKGVISGIMIMIANALMFAVVKMFPMLISELNIEYIFLIFSFGSFFGVVIVYKYLPETFRVSFNEIKAFFRNRT